MAKTTARERRAAAREERRATAPDDPKPGDATKVDEGDQADALRTAASAAIAAAAVSAARALASRHRDEPDEDAPDEREDDSDYEPEEPEASAGDDHATADEDEEPSEQPSEQRDEAPSRGPVPAGAARRMVERAREQLSELHGAEAESVSAVRRTADGWRVGLEVVEVHRVPESTDVLATYEVELDDDGELVTFERTSRYYRSEADWR
jgi:hypothetical protein